MKKFWDEKKDNQIRRYYPNGDAKALAVRLGVTYTALKARAQAIKVRRKDGKKPWTKRQDAYLCRHYATMSCEEIAPKVYHTVKAVYNRAVALKLKKPHEWFVEVGHAAAQHPKAVANRIKKGSVPHNKGKRQVDFMSAEAIERTKATRFQPGQMPHNSRPVGYERIDDDGYVLVKAPGRRKMMLKHRWVWEQHNGPVPEGMCVAFIDGNRLNCDIDNLVLITEAEKALRVLAAETPERKKARLQKAQETRNKTIRLDKARIHFGLEPKTKLVKRW